MGPPQRKRTAPTPTLATFGYDSLQTTTKGKHNLPSITNKESGTISRNAARERYRVRSLRIAFYNLQRSLPSVPPNTKLSKLDVLILATTYISHLSRILSEDESTQENSVSSSDCSVMKIPPCTDENGTRNTRWESSYLHPVRKWPMRSRLYAGVDESETSHSECNNPVLQRRNAWDLYPNAVYTNE